MKGQNGVQRSIAIGVSVRCRETRTQRLARCLSIFPTELGWMGLVGHDLTVDSLTIGHRSESAVRKALPAACRGLSNEDWSPTLRDRLERYARGESISFADVVCDSSHGTEFQRRVLQVTQSLPYGATVTYGQLAELAGRPGAARAVGTTMAQNRIPLIVPCHRVVASGGKLGGYSAAQGISLKKRLLDMEAVATAHKR
jgi:methylated-DNA-[protein]-cysteine S-methyltransferase